MTSPIVPMRVAPIMTQPALGPASPVVGYLPAYGGNAARTIVMAAPLAMLVAGCNAPQPAQQNHEARIPPNQMNCPADGGGSEFCRQLARTEQRVERMREGRDEYNNHNTILVELAFGGGALTVALAFATFFGVRGLRRRARARAEARAAAQAAQPPVDKK